MLPIDKLSFSKEEVSSTTTHIYGKFRHVQSAAFSPKDEDCNEQEERAKHFMRHRLWDQTYGDLRQPLNELMFLARRVARANPAAYPEAARIEELTGELNDLLDWQKQLAAKQGEETK